MMSIDSCLLLCWLLRQYQLIIIVQKYQTVKEPARLLGTLCENLLSQSPACGEEAGPWPSALKARGLDSRVLLELLIIPLPDPPNSNLSLFI